MDAHSSDPRGLCQDLDEIRYSRPGTETSANESNNLTPHFAPTHGWHLSLPLVWGKSRVPEQFQGLDPYEHFQAIVLSSLGLSLGRWRVTIRKWAVVLGEWGTEAWGIGSTCNRWPSSFLGTTTPGEGNNHNNNNYELLRTNEVVGTTKHLSYLCWVGNSLPSPRKWEQVLVPLSRWRTRHREIL